MNRKTDVSRLRSAPGMESAETGAQLSSCDAAVQRATTLLIHSMQQSDKPISDLGEALGRMAQTLGGLGTPLFGAAAADPTTDVQAVREALARDIAVCIQSLQFHDRLTQQLVQARELLAGHSANSLLTRIPGEPANEGSIEGSVELF